MESESNQNFCYQCGHMLTPEQKFCPECGTRVPGRNPEAVEQEKTDGVGKTTLAERLGREAFRAFVRVGLDEEAGREVEDMKRLLGLLADGRIDPDGFLAALSFVLRTELPSRESLLILD